MFLWLRALTYASLFCALVLVFAPARMLAAAGVSAPSSMGFPQIMGAALVLIGAAVALSCVVVFARFGRGTPVPLDPPRRLVTRGPYRIVRNPMYLGAGVALIGAAAFYGSIAVLAYAGFLFLTSHLFIVMYEEPTLRRTFGSEYDDYSRRVGRWWPRLRRSGNNVEPRGRVG